MRPVTRRSIVIAASILFSLATLAQPASPTHDREKPYRILTSGKQVTVKSSRAIKHIMVWTANGHRIVEQRDLNLSSYSFSANMNQKVLFVMIQYEGMKPFTEKIGVK